MFTSFDKAANEKHYVDFKEEDNAQDIAREVIKTLYNADKNKSDLLKTLNNIVGEYGWVENIGVAILNGLESAINSGIEMGLAMNEGFNKATAASIGFAREHPVYCAVIALGILVIIAPWVIEAI
jgi:hypothetical protein